MWGNLSKGLQGAVTNLVTPVYEHDDAHEDDAGPNRREGAYHVAPRQQRPPEGVGAANDRDDSDAIVSQLQHQLKESYDAIRGLEQKLKERSSDGRGGDDTEVVQQLRSQVAQLREENNSILRRTEEYSKQVEESHYKTVSYYEQKVRECEAAAAEQVNSIRDDLERARALADSSEELERLAATNRILQEQIRENDAVLREVMAERDELRALSTELAVKAERTQAADERSEQLRQELGSVFEELTRLRAQQVGKAEQSTHHASLSSAAAPEADADAEADDDDGEMRTAAAAAAEAATTKKVDEQRARAESAEAELSRVAAVIAAHEAEHAALRTEVETLRADSQIRDSQAAQDLEAQLAALRGELELQHRKREDTLTSQINVLRAKLLDLETEHSSALEEAFRADDGDQVSAAGSDAAAAAAAAAFAGRGHAVDPPKQRLHGHEKGDEEVDAAAAARVAALEAECEQQRQAVEQLYERVHAALSERDAAVEALEQSRRDAEAAQERHRIALAQLGGELEVARQQPRMSQNEEDAEAALVKGASPAKELYKATELDADASAAHADSDSQASWHRKHDELAAEFELLEKEVAALTLERETLIADYDSACRSAEQWGEFASAAKAEAEAKVERLQREQREREAVVDVQVAELRARLAAADEAVEAARSAATVASQQQQQHLEAAESRALEAERDAERARKELAVAEANAAKRQEEQEQAPSPPIDAAELDAQRRRCEELGKERDAAVAEVATMRATVASLQLDLDSERRARATEESTRAHSQSGLAALTTQRDELQAECSRFRDLTAELHRACVETLLKASVQLPPRASFADTVTTLAAEFAQQHAKLAESYAVQQQWADTYAEAKRVNDSVGQQLQDAWNQASELREEMALKDMQVAKLTQQVRSESVRANEVQVALAAAQMEVAELRERVAGEQQRARHGATTASSYEERILALTGELEEAKAALHEREAELTSNARALQNLQTVLESFKQERARDVQERTLYLTHEVESLKAQVVALSAQKNEKRDELEAREQQHRKELAAKNVSISGLQTKLSELRKILEETVVKLNDDHMIDKRVVSQLLINYIHSVVEERGDDRDIVRVMSGLLTWGDDEMERAGLIPGPNAPVPPRHRSAASTLIGGVGGLVRSFWSSTTTSAGGGGGGGGSTPGPTSIAAAWVDFLIKEGERARQREEAEEEEAEENGGAASTSATVTEVARAAATAGVDGAHPS